MNSNIDKAFEKFDECMTLFGKAVSDVFSDFSKKIKIKKGTKIKIKKDSVIDIGKGIHAKLLNDVEAIVVSNDIIDS